MSEWWPIPDYPDYEITKAGDVRHGTHANASKTECPVGHRYDENNTIYEGNRRRCRACRTQQWRRYNARAYQKRIAS